MTEFRADHLRHIQEISDLLKKHQYQIPDGPDIKSLLTQGKVVLANLLGDKAILGAMLTNELETNIAYENMNKHKEKWQDSQEILLRGWEDEKRHYQWIKNNM